MLSTASITYNNLEYEICHDHIAFYTVERFFQQGKEKICIHLSGIPQPLTFEGTVKEIEEIIYKLC